MQEEWPAIKKAKFHRTEMKEISDVTHVKSMVLDRLGFIPTFFFCADHRRFIVYNVDGHDTGVSYIGADKPSLYSYKLKKSGFRIQVCSDMNNIILFASKPAPCRDFNDRTMLVMNIASHIHKLDCVALGGATVRSLDNLSNHQMYCPTRISLILRASLEGSP
ncbi:hypothetical protein BCR41DRAFT_316883 [Lobosporangium transversale]|uniref:Uncharacterized protein n=1 Tax=Lobosporangium transversale TaxID=64571 RepID=A0A1Y2H3L2_9FUNG|nr:hypothetical protein BCR41DRAFT_316883 [Lobosporangium transversale]ORZ28303.1 hypothetical protein BCR41DRAFT_316883 [Lobosporangium transversale]|eukprot:XP_021885988.1 hypothetical protein BCR41DRAFT_316883 [Lobosporangium transversale]